MQMDFIEYHPFVKIIEAGLEEFCFGWLGYWWRIAQVLGTNIFDVTIPFDLRWAVKLK